jgi:hypothetical protein
MTINKNWVFNITFAKINEKWDWYVMFSRLGMYIFKFYGRYSSRDEAITAIKMLQNKSDEELEEIWKKEKKEMQIWIFWR